jgi:hypothetical protein
MTTRAALRALVRNELNDNAATKLWVDADLNNWIVEAIRDYTRELPREISTTVVMVLGTASYVLPTDLITILRVEEPLGFLRAPVETGDHGYRVFAGSIILDPVPSAGTMKLEYLGRYTEPAADVDVIATPATDDDLLIDLTIARALEWIDLDEAKRMRFERQRGSSPRSLAQAHRKRFRDAVEERNRRVRAHTLLAN